MGSGKTPDENYRAALAGMWEKVENGEIAEADAEAIERLCFAFDEEDARETLPTDMYDRRRAKHVKGNTRKAWVNRLRHVAMETQLTTATADDINATTTGWVKQDGPPNKKTVNNREGAVTKFYRYHDDLGVDPSDIVVHKPDDTNGWSERDMLDHEERAALRSVCDHPRDRALYHLALYCGLRNTALRTLRVKDIDLENHEWYFNTTADGLKDIDKPTEARPLFQAERAVRDWLKVHPDPQPENPLICAKPSSRKTDYSDPISRSSVEHSLKVLKAKTACPRCRGEGTDRGDDCPRCNGTGDSDDVETVEKPCNPHMMRHNAVTMWRKHPDITDADIKFYIGHAEDSSVMESTYSHLSSDDHNSRGHSAMGTADAAAGGDDIPPWDETCDSCDHVISPGEDVCDACGTERGTTPWDTPSPDENLSGAEAAVKIFQNLGGIVEATADAEARETLNHIINNPESEEAQRAMKLASGDIELTPVEDPDD